MPIRRHLEKRLLAGARQFPVVTITGPRQSGKTTLARTALKGYQYVSLENPDERRMAKDDPRGFLGRFDGRKVIIDEAQYVPDLFSYIQGLVDEAQEPGRFVLTGSQNFLLLKSISQSLAGRASWASPRTASSTRSLPAAIRASTTRGSTPRSGWPTTTRATSSGTCGRSSTSATWRPSAVSWACARAGRGSC